MTLRLLCAADPGDIHQQRHIELLAKAGVDVHLLDHSIDFRPGCTPAKTRRRWPRSGRRTLGKLLGPAAADRIAERLVRSQLERAWRSSRADVCHVHWIDARVLQAANAGLRPLVVTAYGTDMNGTRLPSYDPELLRQVKAGLAEVDLFIADSEDMIVLAEELAGRKLKSLRLPIGIDTNLFRPGYEAEAAAWRAELRIPDGAPVILSPRIIRPNYRHDVIMKAFARAVRDHGSDAYIVFKAYCTDPACLDEILTIAEQEGITERVRVVDEAPYEKLPVLYAMVDLAVSFPILDAFPVTFLECGACEVPVLTNRRVAYSSNGMDEFLNFMEGEDEASIGALMVRLCGDRATKERARAARQHIVRNFDETVFVRALLGAYETVVKREIL